MYKNASTGTDILESNEGVGKLVTEKKRQEIIHEILQINSYAYVSITTVTPDKFE